jgi:hypothetical protein
MRVLDENGNLVGDGEVRSIRRRDGRLTYRCAVPFEILPGDAIDEVDLRFIEGYARMAGTHNRTLILALCHELRRARGGSEEYATPSLSVATAGGVG